MDKKFSSLKVNVLIQHRTTLKFLKTIGKWVSDPQEALFFKNTTTAMHFCKGGNLQNVQLVTRFQKGEVPGQWTTPNL